MVNRRETLQIMVGGAVGVAGLMVPGWSSTSPRKAAAKMPRRLPIVEAPAAAAVPPEPLGTVTGPDGRPLSFDSDRGRVTITGADLFVQTGIGPRLLRFGADSVADFEGTTRVYASGLAQAGDLVHVRGTTLADYSIAVKQLSINPLGNLIGVFVTADLRSLTVFPRTGKESDTYAEDASEVLYDSRTRLYGGRGNFDQPNRSISDLRRGSWIMCNGYRSRDGGVHALDCFFGNELPPANIPERVLAKIAQIS